MRKGSVCDSIICIVLFFPISMSVIAKDDKVKGVQNVIERNDKNIGRNSESLSDVVIPESMAPSPYLMQQIQASERAETPSLPEIPVRPERPERPENRKNPSNRQSLTNPIWENVRREFLKTTAALHSIAVFLYHLENSNVFKNINHLNRVIFFIVFITFTPFLSANDRLTLSTGVDYSKGAYGATSDTEIWYIPFSLKLEQPRLSYKITLPIIQITGPGYVSGADADPNGAGNSTNTTEAGMGDIIASATYALIPYQAKKPSVDITAKIKLPTADENRGLGTGEADYYLQADGLYSASKLTIFGTVGYKIYGDPPGVNYRNVFYLSLGGAYPFQNELSGGLIYDYRQSATANGAEVSEVLAYVSKPLDKNRKLLVYLVKGFRDGSPDWGIGINLGYIL